jgi:hypothetical protein
MPLGIVAEGAAGPPLTCGIGVHPLWMRSHEATFRMLDT